jgi:hypothetical protein
MVLALHHKVSVVCGSFAATGDGAHFTGHCLWRLEAQSK